MKPRTRFFLLLSACLLFVLSLQGFAQQTSLDRTKGLRLKITELESADLNSKSAVVLANARSGAVLSSLFGASAPMRELPKSLYGVTSEHVADARKVPLIRKSLERLRESGKQPVLRVVYQWSDTPTGGLQELCEGIRQLRDVAFIMLEILDSQSFRKCDVSCYEERSRELVTRLRDSVDIWEIGNEINESWLRRHPKARDEATIRRESEEVSKNSTPPLDLLRTPAGRQR